MKIKTNELMRGLSAIDATSLVVGSVIGTGVFLKTAPMLQSLGSPMWVLLAWVVAGLLSLAGAFTYAELGALFPKTGGEFVYLREGYGSTASFLYGWMRFGIGAPASIAAYAAGSARFFSDALGVQNPLFQMGFAVGAIIIFTSFNIAKVKVGGSIQSFLTLLKVIMTLGLGIGLLVFAKDGSLDNLAATLNISLPADEQKSFLSAFGLAMIAALWAYDGWNNLPMASGEVENAQKNVPRALVWGMALVFGVYLVLNFAYFYVLPIDMIAQASSKTYPNAPSVGAMAATAVFGDAIMGLLSIGFVVSALGAMNGSILTGARVPYAMAKEGLFFSKFSQVTQTTHVPMFSILVQGVIAIGLALVGTFDQLTDAVVFSAWIFYAACAGTVFIFRKKLPNAHRSYKVVGYPIVPILFIFVALALLVNTLWTMPQESGLGALYLIVGWMGYVAMRRIKKH